MCFSKQSNKERTDSFLNDSEMMGYENKQETEEIVTFNMKPIFKDDNLELRNSCRTSSDNSEIVPNEQEFMEKHPRCEEQINKQTLNGMDSRDCSPSIDNETTRSFEIGNSRDRKVALNSISTLEEQKPFKSCQEIVKGVGLSLATSSEITSEERDEDLKKCPDISIYETDGPLKIYIEGSRDKREGFCEIDIISENSILSEIGNLKQNSEQFVSGEERKFDLMSPPVIIEAREPVIIEAMECESDSMTPPGLEFDPRLAGPGDYADSVSELDTMSEYNSPVSRATPSRIPRIQRSNSLMSFRRRCSLQSLPVSASISSRRSSISSRRSSTLSVDTERQPWNYGAGGTPYQKLYPFGKPKRLSVDNYYD